MGQGLCMIVYGCMSRAGKRNLGSGTMTEDHGFVEWNTSVILTINNCDPE